MGNGDVMGIEGDIVKEWDVQPRIWYGFGTCQSWGKQKTHQISHGWSVDLSFYPWNFWGILGISGSPAFHGAVRDNIHRHRRWPTLQAVLCSVLAGEFIVPNIGWTGKPTGNLDIPSYSIYVLNHHLESQKSDLILDCDLTCCSFG